MSKVRSIVVRGLLFSFFAPGFFVLSGCDDGGNTTGTQAKVSAEQKASEDAARKANEEFHKAKGKAGAPAK